MSRATVAAAVVAALLLGAFPSDQPLKPPRYDIPYSTEVTTPHIPWAKTLPGGPIPIAPRIQSSAPSTRQERASRSLPGR